MTISINTKYNLLNILTQFAIQWPSSTQTYQDFILPYPSDGSQKPLSKYVQGITHCSINQQVRLSRNGYSLDDLRNVKLEAEKLGQKV